MKEQVRRLNVEYGFGLSEEEIELVARRGEEMDRLFRPLYEVDLTGVMPIMKIDRRKSKVQCPMSEVQRVRVPVVKLDRKRAKK